MRSNRIIHSVSAHAAGEVGEVIVGGVAPPPGDTLWEQRTWIEEDATLRQFMLNEPRGGVFKHVNLLVPPKHPSADAAFIIMEPEDTPPMSGSNAMCVATVLLETGILPMHTPETRLTLEAPGGLVSIRALCSDGKVTRVAITNLASFVDRLGVQLTVPDLGEITVDTAFGGDSFVLVDAEELRIAPDLADARLLAQLGARITDAANDQLGFYPPGVVGMASYLFLRVHLAGGTRSRCPEHCRDQTGEARSVTLWHGDLRADGGTPRPWGAGCRADHHLAILDWFGV